MTIIVFLVTLAATGLLAQVEPLRAIQGEVFIVLWPVCSILLLGLALAILHEIVVQDTKAREQKIDKGITLNHTDMPHIFSAMHKSYGLKEMENVIPGTVLYYYLLRLYLRGIVRWDNANLYIDEARLEAVKAEGGRHSEVAAQMVKSIRRRVRCRFRCRISDAVEAGKNGSVEPHEAVGDLRKGTKRSATMVKMVMAVLMGLVWGILAAKLCLGMTHGKPVGFLVIMILIGGPFSLVGVRCAVGMIKPKAWIRDWSWADTALRRSPHKISQEMMDHAAHTLPSEQERNILLNAFYVNPDGFIDLAYKTDGDGFLYQFAKEIKEANEKAQKEAERRRREAEQRRQNSQYDSGCTSCTSCSSCSSCSSCGGCGGCGD